MRALELLKRELQNNYEKRPFIIKRELYHKERIEDFHEAIEEIENLQNENNSLVKTLEKYNEEMIELRKQNQDLLNTTIEAQEAITNILERNK